MVDEKLTWTQIMEAYPNEWVIVADAEEDWEAREGCSGRVLYHSPDRDYTHKMQMDLEGEVAVLYTGVVHGRFWLVKPEVSP